jgi:hypothetical protein
MVSMRHCDIWLVIEPDAILFFKQAAAVPAITFRPQRQCREEWRLADLAKIT